MCLDVNLISTQGHWVAFDHKSSLMADDICVSVLLLSFQINMGSDRSCFTAIMSWDVNISPRENGIFTRRLRAEPPSVLSSILLGPLSSLLCCIPEYSLALNDVLFTGKDKCARGAERAHSNVVL